MTWEYPEPSLSEMAAVLTEDEVYVQVRNQPTDTRYILKEIYVHRDGTADIRVDVEKKVSIIDRFIEFYRTVDRDRALVERVPLDVLFDEFEVGHVEDVRFTP